MAFVLLSLMTKLVAISRDGSDGFIWVLLEIVFIIGLSYLFVRMRTAYSSSIPAEESDLYRAATLISEGTLSVGGMDVMPKLLSNPAIFYFSYFISIIFKFTGEGPEVFVYLNTVFALLTALLVYLITRKCGDKICSLVAFMATLFMPTIGFSVYNYDAGLFFSFIILLALYLSIIPLNRKNPGAGSVIAVIFAGLIWGLCIAMEPVSIIALLLLLAFNYRKKEEIKFLLITFVLAVLLYFGLVYLESVYIEEEFMKVLLSGLMRFSPVRGDNGSVLTAKEIFDGFNNAIDSHQSAVSDNYFFLSKEDGTTFSAMAAAWLQLGNQLLYMFVLVLSIACSFYMIRSSHPRIMPVLSMIIASFIMSFLCNNNDYNTDYFLVFLIMSGAIALPYMYDNHHALADKNLNEFLGTDEEAPVEEHVQTEEERVAFLLRSQALIFVGANDAEYNRIKEEERISAEILRLKKSQEMIHNTELPVVEAKPEESTPVPQNIQITPEPVEPEEKIEFLENPLPLPPEHVPKQLDFDADFEIINEDDFDFDYDV